MLKKHGSLFTEIGGFDLAASWMGWENVFSCEKNPLGAAQQRPVLGRKFPRGNIGLVSPRFLAELMGFPVNWMESPFLSCSSKA
ncbi:hypothetical protein [Sphingobacterium siyangense]|uniref:DNA (cytosine-5-)-methyltransferase n=1 Tax=Sphingobacterium siyangense TaxID=459529 RepID=A0A562M783_9SPHI|nr:hypothetical protein [Sphingobacterium siyangense]TWI15672.1 hypothetical protein IQ31_04955 [Sphingobacterium siyangense]